MNKYLYCLNCDSAIILINHYQDNYKCLKCLEYKTLIFNNINEKFIIKNINKYIKNIGVENTFKRIDELILDCYTRILWRKYLFKILKRKNMSLDIFQ